MNSKLNTNGALLVGAVVTNGKLKTGETLGVMRQNRESFIELSKRYRVRRHQDGWFVDGRRHRSQIWEFGVGKLGLTVIGWRLVQKCLRAETWLRHKGIGDSEANFYCNWSDANLINLATLVKLQHRKKRVLHRGVVDTLTGL